MAVGGWPMLVGGWPLADGRFEIFDFEAWIPVAPPNSELGTPNSELELGTPPKSAQKTINLSQLFL